MESEPGQSSPTGAGPFDAATQPLSSVGAPRWDPPTARGPRRRPSVKLVAALVALLLAVSGGLAIAGAVSWPFGQQAQSLNQPTPTPTDFPTFAPTATPTHTPTPVPTVKDWPGTPSSGPSYTPPGGAVNTGCTPKTTAGPWAISSGVASGHATPREIALTFDDGPGADTASILNTLESTHTPATFFIVGVRAHAMPWMVQREWNAGYAIGLHTWDHPDMTTLSPQQRQWEFSSLLQELHNDLGAHACFWFWRPPYGAVNGPVLADAASYGLTTVTWDDDTADWSQPGTQTIINRALGNARPGAIILMHDGPAGRGETAAALPTIIQRLRAQGYTLVTVPQLLRDSAGIAPPTPTPTPTATATPTPTPTPSPTPTDTLTPTATATDTPSPTVTVTP